ncbi:hypothetical protein N6H14_10705 [Paenibacillus sp. CC-CFT747]|nr:hypothetical protein N6H14_10705 [Paenibacillus sp. CC-CFT747]
MLASVINMYHLGWKVHKVGGAAAERTGRRVTLGYPTRAAFALLAVLVSTRTLHFDLFATIVGLIFSQLATLVLGYLSTARSKDSDSSDERGEKE